MPNGKAMSAATRRNAAAGRLDASTAIPKRPFRIRSAAQSDGAASADPWSATDAPSAAKASAVMQPISRRGRRCCLPAIEQHAAIPGPTAMSPAGEAASAVTGSRSSATSTGWPPVRSRTGNRRCWRAAAAARRSQIVGRGERRQSRRLVEADVGAEGAVHRRDGDGLPRNRSRMRIEDHGFAPQ